jgi:ABC-type Fe2+-enterobactin transport system substrate-binding protein
MINKRHDVQLGLFYCALRARIMAPLRGSNMKEITLTRDEKWLRGIEDCRCSYLLNQKNKILHSKFISTYSQLLTLNS